jgi:metallophosphoesterase superfamily enzyme
MIEKNNQRRYRISSDLAEKLDLVPNSSGRYRLSKDQEDVYFNLINQKEQINTRTPLTHRDVFQAAFKGIEHKLKLQGVNEVVNEGKNVLVIGDLHLPFCLEGYLEHCKQTYLKYNCDTVIFIGDIIDNHASSYHETDPDGMSAGSELKLAIQQVKEWYNAFPNAHVTIGNHDRLIMRKAMTSGLSKMWIKDYAEVLGVPNWKFVESVEIDDILYIHGEGGTARTRARRDLQSVVQGHLHTQCYTDWIVGAKFKIFGMQVGCGVDNKAYAMAYGKNFGKPAIACGVVEKGETAINVLMKL